MELEAISNPIAPAHLDTGSTQSDSKDTHHLTNDDFRKLLMTPRAGSSGSHLSSVRSDVHGSVRSGRKMTLGTSDNENRKKKKKFYAALKKQEDDVLAELAKKYRDRAKERRDDANPDYQNEDPVTSMAAYRAVAPDSKSTIDAAERRKRMIEESKFLGGDMKHTHLVKGLDYALLQKVKAELVEKDDDNDEEEDFDDRAFEEKIRAGHKRSSESDSKDEDWTPKSAMAVNILALINKEKLPIRNELFLPGRMAYTIDLENPYVDDIPTTIIRSKAECPNLDNLSQLSTNNIVINKLIQIISYLRQGGVPKKKKKDKVASGVGLDVNASVKQEKKKPDFDDSIFGDIGDYVPSFEKKSSNKHKDEKNSLHEHRSDGKYSYFTKPEPPEESKEISFEHSKDNISSNLSAAMAAATSVLESKHIGRLSSKLDQETHESYAECYPGAPENDDAMVDSDDEVDFSKMDVGSKKSTVGRWDFDTQEEYGEYMSKKEALPKAAFQYGVKMVDGRKTRRIPTKKDDKAKIDRDLQKINAILSKRKPDTGEGGSSSGGSFTPRVERDHKRIKHI